VQDCRRQNNAWHLIREMLMTLPTTPRPPLFQRIVQVAASAYLLAMLIYLLARFTLQDRFWPLALVNSFAFVLFVPLPLLLLLALLARSRRALLALLALWFGPRWLPKTTPRSGAPVIRIMTNNIWRLNPTPERVARLVMTTKPDVVFLQEVQLVSQQAALAALNADYPHQTSIVDAIRLGMYEAVNVTLSRQPFVMTEKIALDLPHLPFIYRSVIAVNGQRIALYNVHLVAPVTSRPFVQATDSAHGLHLAQCRAAGGAGLAGRFCGQRSPAHPGGVRDQLLSRLGIAACHSHYPHQRL
jgi:endonuclease/exonuclease/phosphatase (EEP) superfamily protein YafD